MKQKKAENTMQNRLTLRIGDRATLMLFNDLFNTGIWESRNVLANKILAHGIQSFGQRYLGGSAVTIVKNKTVDSNRDLKQIRATTDDMHVILTILERLVACLYNVKVAEITGEKVSPEEMTSGLLAELPDEFQTMKDEIIRMRAKRTGVDNE